MTNKILDKHGKVFAAFLDIEKCFDKIWGDGLLYKLHRIGITDKLWLLFKDWLHGSQGVVYVNGKFSEKFDVTRSIIL